MIVWAKAILAIKKVFTMLTLLLSAIWIFKKGKEEGRQEIKDKIVEANKRAEEVRDNVEDRVRNTPDTVVDDELDPFMRD